MVPLPGAGKNAEQGDAVPMPDPFDWQALYHYQGSDNSPASADTYNTNHHQKLPQPRLPQKRGHLA